MNGTGRLGDTRHKEREHQYDDIIHLSHPVSRRHPQMSLHDRAAQFSPFAALTGYEESVRETARQTQERIELDEDCRRVLDEKLRRLKEGEAGHPEFTITYFKEDTKKQGGAYVHITGRMKKLDLYKRLLFMENGEQIPLENVMDIKGELFQEARQLSHQ